MVLDSECRALEPISVTGSTESSGSAHNLRLMAGSTVDRGCRLALKAAGKRLVFPGAIDLNCFGILRGSGHSGTGDSLFRWRPDGRWRHALNRVLRQELAGTGVEK